MKRRRRPVRFIGTQCLLPTWCGDCGKTTTPCTVRRRRGQRACPQHYGWELYMVRDDVWAAADGPEFPGGFLCVGCLERTLGRQLVPDDFTDCSLNTESTSDSDRLANRKRGTSAQLSA